jgi:hypothetical protein
MAALFFFTTGGPSSRSAHPTTTDCRQPIDPRTGQRPIVTAPYSAFRGAQAQVAANLTKAPQPPTGYYFKLS